MNRQNLSPSRTSRPSLIKAVAIALSAYSNRRHLKSELPNWGGDSKDIELLVRAATETGDDSSGPGSGGTPRPTNDSSGPGSGSGGDSSDPDSGSSDDSSGPDSGSSSGSSGKDSGSSDETAQPTDDSSGSGSGSGD